MCYYRLRMRRSISSKATTVYKYVVPTITIIIIVIVLAVIAGASVLVPVWFTALYVVWSLCLTSMLFWMGSKLKAVSMDQSSLYVEEGSAEISIPFSDVAKVSQLNWIKPYPVVISLRDGHPYGKKVMFVPPMEGFFGAWKHPIVEELSNRTNSLSETR